MKRTKIGRYITVSTVGEKCKAFVPASLPPKPDLKIDYKLRELMDQAILAIGRLDSISLLLPDTDVYLYMYVRKEAVLSSQIEGTQSSLSELLAFENGHLSEDHQDDVQEVSNYVSALDHGLKLLRSDLPVSLRLIREIHKVLLAKGRGSDKTPGQFRASQNWIGGTRPGNAAFVPPPPQRVMDCMSELETFLHNKKTHHSTLLKAALAHAQFETIHPFLDGNGRVGRLLITLLLCAEGMLKEPMLYLSLYFKTHRQAYYRLLQKIRDNGDWESWIEFFMKAVGETASQATQTARKLLEVADLNRAKIQEIKRASGSALRVHHALLQRPILSIAKTCELTGLWTTSVTTAIGHLERIGIVEEITGSRRNRLYRYTQYVQILNEGTEL